MAPRPTASHHAYKSRCLVASALLALAAAGCTAPGQSTVPGPGTTPGESTAPGQTTADGSARGTPQSGQRSQGGAAKGGAGLALPQAAADIPTIVSNVQPSVVTIFTRDGGLGSGVVYSEDGLILTNEHVVRGNTGVEVAFADGRRVAGTVRATDPISDLALVEAKRTGLPAAKFQSDLPRIGELAVVIGSPLGFENTATAGIISGLHREIPGSASSSQSLVDLIQTDAAISPGNSGGAVVNSRSEVIGISEAYIPPSAGAVALGFAIPAATAVKVADQLREDGTADHAFIGLSLGEITQQIADQLGLPDTRGALALSVPDGGPAAKAGIRPGDVLVRLDGDELASPESLLAALRSKSPGQTVTVEYRRGTETQETKVELTARPAP
ncbi:S1C family serine protease [Arthrobacter sp. QXT-31]|uniref:S1C family serine protease n=1 Tax=Arthrobacter sp. QXT-31 TaxID=1357915 RepID=UPI00097193FD|nr:trypsin-like peptidase domain-containing protein [Arthrobacter sp. QXT-31]APX01750.1 signal protein PDZ [Arthrobacter sp. QXT-31]